MKHAVPSAARGLPVAAALALLSGATGAYADQTVQVGPGLAFSPSTVTVSPGETVVWNFQGFHTSTSDTATGPEVWDSGFLSSGTFSHMFQTPGTYPYYCQVHSFPGGTAMNGVVMVQGGVPTPTSTPIPATSTPVPPTSTPSESATPVARGSPIPTLDGGGRILFVLALLAAGVMALFLSGR